MILSNEINRPCNSYSSQYPWIGSARENSKSGKNGRYILQNIGDVVTRSRTII